MKKPMVSGIAGLLIVIATASLSQEPKYLIPTSFFRPFAVQVIEDSSRNPVSGAVIKPVCLGGTAFATNSYVTDSMGHSVIMIPTNSWFILHLTKPGYNTASIIVQRTNPVVVLKKTVPAE